MTLCPAMLLGMLVACATCSGVSKQSQKESAAVLKSLNDLSSEDPLLRKEAFQQLWKTPPLSMAPLIEIVRKMKPVVSPDGTLNHYAYDSTPQFAIRLLGHHRVKEAIGPLIEQIGYRNHDQMFTSFPDRPTVVKALANMGNDVVPHVIKKLATIEYDGIRREHCFSVLQSLHKNNNTVVYRLLKSEFEKKSYTDSEARNLRDALLYFHYSEERKQYEFVHRRRPPLNDNTDYFKQ